MIRSFAALRGDRGFTLVELMVVILVIAALALIALPSFLNQSDKAKDLDARQALIVSRKGAKAEYVSNGHTYPAQTELVQALRRAEPQYNYAAGAGTADQQTISVEREGAHELSLCLQAATGRFFCLRIDEHANQLELAPHPSLLAKLLGAEVAYAAAGVDVRYSTGRTEDDARAALQDADHDGYADTGPTGSGRPGWPSVPKAQREEDGDEDNPPAASAPWADLIAEDGPIAWYRLDGTSNDEVRSDASGHGKHGGFTNSGSLTFGRPGAVAGSTAVGFGYQDVSRGDVRSAYALQFGRSFTVEAWISPADNSWDPASYINLQYEKIMAYYYNEQQWFFLRRHDGRLAVRVFVGGSQTEYVELVSPAAVPAGEWSHVAFTVTYDDNDGESVVRLYVNGQMVASGSFAGSVSTHVDAYQQVNIGGQDLSRVGARGFRGDIDEVVFYDKPLSQQRIAEHANAF